jgi:hypothetical protein
MYFWGVHMGILICIKDQAWHQLAKCHSYYSIHFCGITLGKHHHLGLRNLLFHCFSTSHLRHSCCASRCSSFPLRATLELPGQVDTQTALPGRTFPLTSYTTLPLHMAGVLPDAKAEWSCIKSGDGGLVLSLAFLSLC